MTDFGPGSGFEPRTRSGHSALPGRIAGQRGSRSRHLGADAAAGRPAPSSKHSKPQLDARRAVGCGAGSARDCLRRSPTHRGACWGPSSPALLLRSRHGVAGVRARRNLGAWKPTSRRSTGANGLYETPTHGEFGRCSHETRHAAFRKRLGWFVECRCCSSGPSCMQRRKLGTRR